MQGLACTGNGEALEQEDVFVKQGERATSASRLCVLANSLDFWFSSLRGMDGRLLGRVQRKYIGNCYLSFSAVLPTKIHDPPLSALLGY